MLAPGNAWAGSRAEKASAGSLVKIAQSLLLSFPRKRESI